MKAGKCKPNPPENVEKFIEYRQRKKGKFFLKKPFFTNRQPVV